jgi:hypothetical protein
VLTVGVAACRRRPRVPQGSFKKMQAGRAPGPVCVWCGSGVGVSRLCESALYSCLCFHQAFVCWLCVYCVVCGWVTLHGPHSAPSLSLRLKGVLSFPACVFATVQVASTVCLRHCQGVPAAAPARMATSRQTPPSSSSSSASACTAPTAAAAAVRALSTSAAVCWRLAAMQAAAVTRTAPQHPPAGCCPPQALTMHRQQQRQQRQQCWVPAASTA